MTMSKRKNSNVRAKKSSDPKSTTHEQEGFARAIGVPKDGVPACSSGFSAHGYSLNDFRGDITDGKRNIWFKYPAHKHRRAIEWETSPAKSSKDTTFTWIGGSQVRPAYRPAFPYHAATLYVN